MWTHPGGFHLHGVNLVVQLPPSQCRLESPVAPVPATKCFSEVTHDTSATHIKCLECVPPPPTANLKGRESHLTVFPKGCEKQICRNTQSFCHPSFQKRFLPRRPTCKQNSGATKAFHNTEQIFSKRNKPLLLFFSFFFFIGWVPHPLT